MPLVQKRDGGFDSGKLLGYGNRYEMVERCPIFMRESCCLVADGDW
jgi:hypothetical protein